MVSSPANKSDVIEATSCIYSLVILGYRMVSRLSDGDGLHNALFVTNVGKEELPQKGRQMGPSVTDTVTLLPRQGSWESAAETGKWVVGIKLEKKHKNQPPYREQNKLFRSEQSNRY